MFYSVQSAQGKDSIFKLNGNTFRGGNSAIFFSIFCEGQLSKERICSSRSKFFPLRVDPIKVGTRETDRKYHKL